MLEFFYFVVVTDSQKVRVFPVPVLVGELARSVHGFYCFYWCRSVICRRQAY